MAASRLDENRCNNQAAVLLVPRSGMQQHYTSSEEAAEDAIGARNNASHHEQEGEEEDNGKEGGLAHSKSKKKKRKLAAEETSSQEEGGQGGGGSGDMMMMMMMGMRKPRGRPPGSKNKPKPPLIITRDSESAMRPHVLEVAGGHDVGEILSAFARQLNRGICVLSGNGSVTSVTIRQPVVPSSTITFHGRYEILSLSGAFLPDSYDSSSPPSEAAAALQLSGGLSISVAGGQGQVVGGSVAGVLTAAGPVLIIAASFISPPLDRLPMQEEDDNNHVTPPSTAQQHPQTPQQQDSLPQQQQQQPLPASSHMQHYRYRQQSGVPTTSVSAVPLQVSVAPPAPASAGLPPSSSSPDTSAMTLFSSHLPPDVFAWAASGGNSRPPPY